MCRPRAKGGMEIRGEVDRNGWNRSGLGRGAIEEAAECPAHMSYGGVPGGVPRSDVLFIRRAPLQGGD